MCWENMSSKYECGWHTQKSEDCEGVTKADEFWEPAWETKGGMAVSGRCVTLDPSIPI